MRKALGTLVIVFVVLMFAGCIAAITGLMSQLPQPPKLTQPSILTLELDGVILDSKSLLKQIRDYAGEENVRGVVIRVNSPGGVVGASQEIYSEVKRIKEELGKPVVVSGQSMVTSGAYYAALGANKIYVNPGTLLGSIGVMMNFANLEDLYDWAKIKRYTIKTGTYKDSGADYRAMRDDERALFQRLADEVLNQFKSAVIEGRGLDPQLVARYADGRVFTGETAVQLGFADAVGTYEDAIREVGQLSGLGVEPKLFRPPPQRKSVMEFIAEAQNSIGVNFIKEEVLRTQLLGQPLYLMPGVL